MINMNLSALVASLNQSCRSALEEAAGACVARGGHEISIEDYLEKLLPLPAMQDVLIQFEISGDKIAALLDKRKAGNGNGGRPVFSQLLIEFLQEAYLLSSLELRHEEIGPPVLVLALLSNPARYGVMPFFQELGKIPADGLRRLLEGLSEKNAARSGGAPAAGNNLKNFTTDFTEEARQGKIDPVFARGPEIRQMVDILTRRRKNNPILVGDPGVGKTAVVEGLALRVVEGQVPEAMRGVRVIGLDMGRLQAGASVKGEFEKRLKGVIDEIKGSPTPIILFIDEAHTLVGSGNQAGSGDGANLLKPALARGELRTIAATTWSEYKKYFEKDAALARRFQLVKLDEPGIEDTVTILRGLVPYYEKMHRVYVRDDAVRQAAELSSRYVSGRYQPDKAIDVLDTACSRVKVSLGAKPRRLEVLEENMAGLNRHIQAMERDRSKGVSSVPGSDAGAAAEHASLKARADELRSTIKELNARWKKEKELVEEIIRARAGDDAADSTLLDETESSQGEPQNEHAETREAENDAASPASSRDAAPVRDPYELAAMLREAQAGDPLVFYEVGPELVADVVSEWTGVSLDKMGGQSSSGNGGKELSRFGLSLRRRILGQEAALDIIEKAVMAAQAGLNNPGAPTGIFMLVGPSGVGKTETALAVADELFGGEQMLVSINMSEFQEKHTISRLIGSPPGYVGYGEGGRLTEAVRRQPYSAVLFDEVEKAHPDVINLFYQVFDKGVLADGEGREIDFKNTMIFLTSNLGAEIIAALCEEGEFPEQKVLQEAIRPALSQFFRPALLGRMTIVPYTPISHSVMEELARAKLGRIGQRMEQRHRIRLACDETVICSIAASCTAVDTGARNIDHIVNSSLMPGISETLLGSMNASETTGARELIVSLAPENGGFIYRLV